MAEFPLLVDPDSYRPNTIDMAGDPAARAYWLSVFEANRDSMMRHAVASVGGGREAEDRARAYADAFSRDLLQVCEAPEKYPQLSIGFLCGVRRKHLLDHGFIDPYRHIKERENAAALRLLPALLKELDDLAPSQRVRRLVENIFAGNLFDLGCSGTIAMYEQGKMDFHATRSRLPDRPWLVDHLDLLEERLNSRPPVKAVMLVDNAGADIVLGMIPLVRHLLSLGSQVILSANTHPALNDITHEELGPLLQEVVRVDPVIAGALKDGRLQPVASGNDKPVIDLRETSEEFCHHCRDADLLVLEGMGRSLETNYQARFCCDAIKIAMVKEEDIAGHLGGKIYDVVCRFDPAA